jgi:riboflavin transporter FmnP
MKNLSKSTNFIIKVAILSAFALILMYISFPVLPGFSYLQIDLSDVPALVGAFAFGPLAGALIEGIKNILILLVKGSYTGGVGEFANFVVGCFFVCTSGLIYKYKKTRKTAIISMLVAIVFMSVAAVLANYFVFVPLYFKSMSMKDLIHYMVYGIIPFNLIKGVLISVVTIVIYKRVSVLIHDEAAKTWNYDKKRGSV